MIKQNVLKLASTINFRYFFPLLHIVACKQQTQKTPSGRGKSKKINASEFLTIIVENKNNFFAFYCNNSCNIGLIVSNIFNSQLKFTCLKYQWKH